MVTTSLDRPTQFLWPITIVLVIISVIYAAQIPTPLRMNTDAIAYLSMANSYHGGHGFITPYGPTHFPSGYPALIAALDHFGWAQSRGFVALNELFLAFTLWIGVWLIRRWLDLPIEIALASVALLLLNRSTIRYCAIPGSEFAYMLVAMIGLACLTRSVELPRDRTARALAWWAMGVLSLGSMWFRTIGFVLLPALGWSLVLIIWQRRRTQIPLPQWAVVNRKPLIGAGCTAIVLGAIAGLVISRTNYFHEQAELFAKHGLRAEMWFTLRQRMIDSASILTNFWYREVDPRHQRRLMYAGVIALPLTLLVIVRRLRSPRPVDVYIMAYVALLMVWPYKADNRFWLPIQLFIYALFARELLTAAEHGRAWAKPLAIAWAGLLVVMGIVVLTWTTRLTYSGDRFIDRYDMEWARDAYRVASHEKFPVRELQTQSTQINPNLLAMIRRYGRPQFGP